MLSRVAAPDAPAQLVQLRQAETLGVLDHHQRGVGHVHADLDDRGGDQQLDAALRECLHHRAPSRRRAGGRAPGRRAGPRSSRAASRRCRSRSAGRRPSTPRSPGRPSTPARPRRTRRGCARAPRRAAPRQTSLRHNRRAPRRQLVDGRHVEVGVVGHRQRARDRRGAHHQLVRRERSRVSLAFLRSASRCSTPKRCCSSTTASAELARTRRLSGSARACRWRPAPRPAIASTLASSAR